MTSPDMRTTTDDGSRAAGLAALSLCEALALALAEEGILQKDGLCGAIDDAISTHRNAATGSFEPEVHRKAASLVERVKRSIEASLPDMPAQ